MAFFAPRYRYWAREPDLSRFAVQQTIDYNLARNPGPELARFDAGRQVLIGQLAALFENEQQRGQIVATQSPKTIAWLFMSIYQAEVRRWLRADKPSVAAGLKQLRELFLAGADRRRASPTAANARAADASQRTSPSRGGTCKTGSRAMKSTIDAKALSMSRISPCPSPISPAPAAQALPLRYVRQPKPEIAAAYAAGDIAGCTQALGRA